MPNDTALRDDTPMTRPPFGTPTAPDGALPSQSLPHNAPPDRHAPLSCPLPPHRTPGVLRQRKLRVENTTWQRIQREAQARGLTTAAHVRAILEHATATTPARHSLGPSRQIRIRLWREEDAVIRELARRRGVTPNECLHELLALGIQARRDSEQIPAAKADQMRDEIRHLEALVDRLGPTVCAARQIIEHLTEKLLGLDEHAIEPLRLAADAAGAEQWNDDVAFRSVG